MILATGNPHKVREMAEALLGVELKPLPAGV
jgi:inosine/xanthosine triphosphate pyrophosphatase family protein